MGCFHIFPYPHDLAVEKQHGVEEGTTSLPTPVNDGRQQKSLVSWGFQRTTFFQKGSHGNSDRKTNHPFEVRIHRKKVAANWQFFIDTGCVFKECKPKSGTKFLRHFFVGSCNSITLAVRCSSRAFTKHALNGNLSQGSH